MDVSTTVWTLKLLPVLSDFPKWRLPPSWICHACVWNFGSPKKGIWWSLSLCKIWLESIRTVVSIIWYRAFSLPGPFAPWRFRSLEPSRRVYVAYIFLVASFRAISLRGAKVPGSELAKVLLDDSLLGGNWPGSEKAVNR